MGATLRDRPLVGFAVGLGFGACAATPAPSKPASIPAPHATITAAQGQGAPAPRPNAAPRGPLDLEQARQYLLSLVNRDRSGYGLPPLPLDEAATRAGQRHAEDMAHAGYTAHLGTDGSVPEQRYSEAGGTDFVQENAGCLADGRSRVLEAPAHFEARQIERVERAFMDETPPRDGHRRNILKPTHSALGLGIAKPVGVDLACLSQEFVDDYGDYGALPRSAAPGAMIHIEGDVKSSVAFGGVGIGRIELGQPLTAAYLNTTYVYPVPAPQELYFPAGFVTKKPVLVRGKHFSIDVPLGNAGESGRYEVSIWGRFPGAGPQLDMISLRVLTSK